MCRGKILKEETGILQDAVLNSHNSIVDISGFGNRKRLERRFGRNHHKCRCEMDLSQLTFWPAMGRERL